MSGIDVEIEQAWVMLSGRCEPIELRLSKAGRILGFFPHREKESGVILGTFDRRVSLIDFREAVFHEWEQMRRG